MYFSFILYYFVLFVSVSGYYSLLKKNRMPIVSISSISYSVSIFTIMLPGYYIANGEIINDILGSRLDFCLDLYLVYLAYMLLTPIGLLIGQVSAKKHHLIIIKRKDFNRRIFFAFLAVLIYDVLYLIWVPYNPLMDLLVNKDLSDIAIKRLAITHGIGSYTKVPFIFRYWRLFVYNFSPILIFYYIQKQRINSWLKIWLFVLLITLLFFTLEKVVIIYLCVFYIITKLFIEGKTRYFYSLKGIINRKNLLFLFISIFILILMYVFIMGSEDPLASIFMRTFRQSASTRIMIEYVKDAGFFGIKGMDMPILGDLIDYNYINLSKKAIIDIYPNMNSTELAGSAGGMSFAELYFMFGWYSIAIYLLAMFLTGFMDKILFNTCWCKYNLRNDSHNLMIIIYSYLCGFHIMSLGASVFIFFSFPLLLSPGILLLALFSALFIRIYRIV